MVKARKNEKSRKKKKLECIILKAKKKIQQSQLLFTKHQVPPLKGLCHYKLPVQKYHYDNSFTKQ